MLRIFRGILTFALPALLAAGCFRSSDVVMGVPACGVAGRVQAPAELARWPYLQSVTSTAAVVVWGTRGEAPGWLRLGEASRAVTAEPFARIAFGGQSVSLRAARLRGLRPATRYCYAIGAGDETFARGLAFETAPAVTETTARFLVLGDYGAGRAAQYRVREQLAKHAAPLLITTGDNAYPNGTHEQFQEKVFDVYRSLFAQTAIYPSPGNHDYRTGDAGPYLTNFVLPEQALRGRDNERYYSFDWGPVHFVALDSERSLTEALPGRADDMLDWLERDLKAATRPWTIVYFHRPPYSASRHDGSLPVREKLVPVLEKYRVPLVFNGHNHSYERFHPQRGVTYVTTGGGGAHGYPIGASPLLAAGSEDYHFVKAEADVCKIKLTAINDAGEIIDEHLLKRCP